MNDLITAATSGLFVEVGKVIEHMKAQASRIADLERQLAEASAPQAADTDKVREDWRKFVDQWMGDWDVVIPTDGYEELLTAPFPAASMAAQAPVREVPGGMPVTQEPKYGIRDNRLFNRASGEFIPEDEPVFIFRARDRHAIYAIAQYKGHFLRDESHKDAVGKRIQDFRNFMEANPARMKEPDTALPAAPVQQEGE